MFAELGLVFMLTIGVALGGLGGYWVRSLIARSEQQALRAQLESETQATQKVQLEREQSLEQHSRWLHDQIKLLAAQMLDERTKQFTVQSEQQLGRLIEPLKDRIVEFRAKLDDVQLKDVERAAQLQAELNQLKSLNQQMTQEAHKLSTALQGQSKVQGHWGELVLSNLLERSGLRDGTDFRREVSFQTDSGRKRPDAIVFLPQGKHIVIDAKVSLNAYTRYVNALDNHERSVALQEHLRAINDRVQELSSRSYAELPGLNTPEIVFMFIPIESAFGEAMRGDSTLFQKAMDQQVVITTPTTLLTSLQIVRQLWRFEDQHKHSAELAERAAKIYKKLVAFVSTMEAIDQSLSKARDSYDKERLGVAVHSSLPEALVARAELELEPSTNLTKDLAD
ncbi:MAG: DNA recombination protein RmuC [Betaproteobacteria bacterium]|nr:DNA recombination protein RmuC [Betaproteobacteria bacterium]